MIKISIIVPIYKVRDYIERCIDSIINQESVNFALECIFVNDCTPDDSMEIVTRKIDNYNGKIDFVVINHDRNMGLSASRNTGVKFAKGDFVFFLDSDDWLETKALEYLIDGDYCVANCPRVDVIMGNSFVCKINQSAINIKTDTYLLLDNNKEMALQKLLSRELFHTAWNKLVRRDLLLCHDISFEEGIVDEDLLWSYYVFLNAKGVLVKPGITYIYEDNPGSIMNTTSDIIVNRINSRIIICKRLLSSPPKLSFVEFYLYVFFILTRAINLYESNINDVALRDLEDNLFAIRNRLLDEVRRKRFFWLYLFFMTSKRPFYFINNCRWFRRYYDRIVKCVMRISKL